MPNNPLDEQWNLTDHWELGSERFNTANALACFAGSDEFSKNELLNSLEFYAETRPEENNKRLMAHNRL